MKRSILILFLVTTFVFFCQDTHAQDSAKFYNKNTQIPGKLFKKLNVKTTTIDNKLSVLSARYLRQMAKEERKLRNRLSKTDSVAAGEIFSDVTSRYALLEEQLRNKSANLATSKNKYLPHLDSLQTAFKFLATDRSTIKSSAGYAELNEVLNRLDVLQNNFTQAETLQQCLQQRGQFLQDQLVKYGFTKSLKKIQRQVYYYQVQVDEYQKVFSNPSKIESGVLTILQRTTLFKSFFNQHSQLAGLFRMPEVSTGGPLASFARLQTHDGVQQQLLQKFGSLPDIKQVAASRDNEVEAKINQLKDKTGKLLTGNGNTAMPAFKPNDQKTGSLIKRIELGANMQTVKNNYFFPATTDIALSVGYKLNNKSTVGLGSSYKMGWGRDIRHVTITNQGVGIRSFIDFKIKGNFWLSGGAEMNYRSQFHSFEVLNNYNPWQKSALIGLSKKYQVTKKLKGNMQLLYDFLSKQQVPRTQPLVFRIGYLL